MASELDVFVDADVIFAGAASPSEHRASNVILRMAETHHPYISAIPLASPINISRSSFGFLKTDAGKTRFEGLFAPAGCEE